jgi:hypothetical protein
VVIIRCTIPLRRPAPAVLRIDNTGAVTVDKGDSCVLGSCGSINANNESISLAVLADWNMAYFLLLLPVSMESGVSLFTTSIEADNL